MDAEAVVGAEVVVEEEVVVVRVLRLLAAKRRQMRRQRQLERQEEMARELVLNSGSGGVGSGRQWWGRVSRRMAIAGAGCRWKSPCQYMASSCRLLAWRIRRPRQWLRPHRHHRPLRLRLHLKLPLRKLGQTQAAAQAQA